MPKHAIIKYFALNDMMPRSEKLQWFADNTFEAIPFQTIQPDKTNNWINLADNDDWDTFLPVCSKEKHVQSIFSFHTLGVSTNRDAWVYDFDKKNLGKKMQYFCKEYNDLLAANDNSFPDNIKWSRDLKKKFDQKKKTVYSENLIVENSYRPFTKQFFYAEKIFNDILTQNHYDIFGKNLQDKNPCMTLHNHAQLSVFSVCATETLPDAGFSGRGTPTIPRYFRDKTGNKIENITDWALNAFREHYADNNISKTNIFEYVYAVLHAPAYREKYALNLKRDFPRIPFYSEFEKWASWGKMLLDLHLNYETVAPYPLQKEEIARPKNNPRPKLKADKAAGELIIDENTKLTGVPESAWSYKLGNRSALEWILDQYKESTPSDPTIALKFNAYQFAQYKSQVIELLMRVCSVSVQTMEIVEKM